MLTPLARRLVFAVVALLQSAALTHGASLADTSDSGESNTKGWHRVWRDTQEFHSNYTLATYSESSYLQRDPAHVWETYRRVAYIEHAPKYHNAKIATSQAHHALDGEHSEIMLSWTDADGSVTTENCDDAHKNGNDTIFHQLKRADAEGKTISGYNIMRDTGKDPVFARFNPEKNVMEVVKDRIDDTTECENREFPFGLLKSKPPVY